MVEIHHPYQNCNLSIKNYHCDYILSFRYWQIITGKDGRNSSSLSELQSKLTNYNLSPLWYSSFNSKNNVVFILTVLWHYLYDEVIYCILFMTWSYHLYLLISLNFSLALWPNLISLLFLKFIYSYIYHYQLIYMQILYSK